jgi:hypothetical protein
MPDPFVKDLKADRTEPSLHAGPPTSMPQCLRSDATLKVARREASLPNLRGEMSIEIGRLPLCSVRTGPNF